MNTLNELIQSYMQYCSCRKRLDSYTHVSAEKQKNILSQKNPRKLLESACPGSSLPVK